MRFSVSPAALALAAALGTGSALAQPAAAPEGYIADDQAPQVEDTIIVRGRYAPPTRIEATKTPTPLIDVPQSLSLLTRDQIDDQAFFDLADASRFVPGFSTGQGEGHRDQITIRGQNTTADFFLDGLRDDAQYFRPLYNLERIEILRGSNALLFGRGGGGGIVNRVTKTAATGETFGSAIASVDTFGAAYVAADGNAALGDRAALRVNAFYESLDNHRDFFGGDRFAVNPTLTANLTPDTRIVLSYEYVNDERVVDRGVPSLNGEPLESFDNTFFGDPDRNFTILQANIGRARIDHDFSDDWAFNATIQYADYNKVYQNLFPEGFDPVAGTVTLDGYRDPTNRDNLIIQSNLVGEFETGFIGHTLLFGAEYGDQDTANRRFDTVFAANGDDQLEFLFSDPLVIPDVSFSDLSRDRTSDVQFVSVYLQDQVSLGQYVQVVGGVRYDRFDIDVTDLIEIADGTADGNDGFLGRVDEEVSPRVGVILTPMENVSVYSSFSRSFLPRSGDQFLTLTLNDEALAPEEYENIEVGAKWDPTPALSLTAALFRLDLESGTTVDPNDVGNTILIGSRTHGLELQAVGQILENWTLNAGYAYLDADERGRVVGTEFANRTLAQVPEHMFSLWNRYEVSDRLGFGLGVTWQSEQFASISNAVELPDFTRVDAALYYALTERVQLQVNVENLFDADVFPAAHSDNNITTAEPLNARFTVSTRF